MPLFEQPVPGETPRERWAREWRNQTVYNNRMNELARVGLVHLGPSHRGEPAGTAAERRKYVEYLENRAIRTGTREDKLAAERERHEFWLTYEAHSGRR